MHNKSMVIKYGSKEDSLFFKSNVLKKNLILYITIDNFFSSIQSQTISTLVQKFDVIVDPITFCLFDEIQTNKRMNYLNNIFGNLLNENYEEKIKWITDYNNLNDIIKKTIMLQEEKINEYTTINTNSIEKEYLPFLEFFKKETNYIIPPYFISKKQDCNHWKKILSINKNINKIIFQKKESDINFKQKEIIFPILLYPKWLLDKEMNDYIITNYSEILDEKTIFWLSEFSIEKYEYDDLLKIKEFLNNFTNKEKYLLHSDFLTSLFLNCNFLKNNFKYIVTNLGYGEYRTFFGKGRQPKPYFYAPKLHKRLNGYFFNEYLESKGTINENGDIDIESFQKNICNCEYCTKMLNTESNIYNITKIMEMRIDDLNDRQISIKKIIKMCLMEHFIKMKQIEYDKLFHCNKSELIYILQEMLNEHNDFLKKKNNLNDKNEIFSNRKEKLIKEIINDMENNG